METTSLESKGINVLYDGKIVLKFFSTKIDIGISIRAYGVLNLQVLTYDVEF